MVEWHMSNDPHRIKELRTGERICLRERSGEEESFIVFDQLEVEGSLYFILKQEKGRERFWILRPKEDTLVSCETEEEMDTVIARYTAKIEQKQVEG